MIFLKQLPRLLFVVSLLMLLPACAETEFVSHWFKSSSDDTRVGEGGGFKVGKPYRVGTSWYTPQESYDYEETGIASWYGSEFGGKRTANNEVFDPNALTCAHKTLQMPSLIRVTNLDNGRVVNLRVNDRGPFSRGRVLDVSRKGAELLGFKNIGTARVKIQVLRNESLVLAQAAKKGVPPSQFHTALKDARGGAGYSYGSPAETYSAEPTQVRTASVQSSDLPPLEVPMHAGKGGVYVPDEVVTVVPVQKTGIYIQVGSFSQASNADAARTKLAGLGNVSVSQAVVRGTSFSRVRLGPVNTVEQADALLSKTLSRGFQGAKIIVE